MVGWSMVGWSNGWVVQWLGGPMVGVLPQKTSLEGEIQEESTELHSSYLRRVRLFFVNLSLENILNQVVQTPKMKGTGSESGLMLDPDSTELKLNSYRF